MGCSKNTVINAYIKKQEIYQLNNLKEFKKEKKMKPKVSRRKKITKITAYTNKIETQRQQKRSMKLRSGFLKR